jgi:hypothetical protein
MTLLWARSSNIVDWLIALFTGQDCAHFAFSFTVNGQQLVFESYLLGTRTVFYNTWMKAKGRTVVHQIEVPLSDDEIADIWSLWVQNYDGEMYDFTGAIYTGLMELRQRIFKIPKPRRNPWSMKNSYYCDEVYQLVSGKPGFPVITRRSNGMDSPHDLYTTVSST